MNKIQENKGKVNSLNISMIDCVKVGSYSEHMSAVYVYLTTGERVQVTRPVFNCMIKQGMAKEFVTKYFDPMVKRRLTTIGGGLACVNLQNVQCFEVEPCGDREHARVDAKFKSGRTSFLYTVSANRAFDEQDKLITMLGLTPEELSSVDE